MWTVAGLSANAGSDWTGLYGLARAGGSVWADGTYVDPKSDNNNVLVLRENKWHVERRQRARPRHWQQYPRWAHHHRWTALDGWHVRQRRQRTAARRAPLTRHGDHPKATAPRWLFTGIADQLAWCSQAAACSGGAPPALSAQVHSSDAKSGTGRIPATQSAGGPVAVVFSYLSRRHQFRRRYPASGPETVCSDWRGEDPAARPEGERFAERCVRTVRPGSPAGCPSPDRGTFSEAISALTLRRYGTS
jgi:hypothetical protein